MLLKVPGLARAHFRFWLASSFPSTYRARASYIYIACCTYIHSLFFKRLFSFISHFLSAYLSFSHVAYSYSSSYPFLYVYIQHIRRHFFSPYTYVYVCCVSEWKRRARTYLCTVGIRAYTICKEALRLVLSLYAYYFSLSWNDSTYRYKQVSIWYPVIYILYCSHYLHVWNASALFIVIKIAFEMEIYKIIIITAREFIIQILRKSIVLLMCVCVYQFMRIIQQLAEALKVKNASCVRGY